MGDAVDAYGAQGPQGAPDGGRALASSLQTLAPGRWTQAQVTDAIARVSGGGSAPASWGELSDGQRELYAVRVAQDPPMALYDAARALGITRGAAEERWMQVRMLTGCPAMAATREIALSTEAPPVLAEVPEHVTDTDLVLLARRKAYEGLNACNPAQDPKAFKDLATAVGATMRISHEITAAPLELRRRDDREGLRELAQGLLTEMAKRGVSLHTTVAPVLEGEVVGESSSKTPAPGGAAPADPLADI